MRHGGRAWIVRCAAIAALAASGCEDDAPPDKGAPALPNAPVPISPAPGSPAPTASALPSDTPAAEHLEMLRLTLTSGVKDKDPVDKLDAASAGERLYAHLAVRNRTGETRRVRVEFEVNGKVRTTLSLDIQQAWQWRTWGYNTMQKDDSGELTVVVTEEDGPELAQVRVPIRRK